ncbi:hypothetical protein ANO11243_043970 [Dothideomycetidae sp. 11243]|nr:hypothetical protein ANO11243_043970 [fungal sp. No.11243]
MAALLDHSTIGKIQGIAGDGVTQYLGVKYGVLADRFAEAKLPDYAHKSTIDATKHAPAPLSPPDGVDIENSLLQLQKPLPYNDRRVSDIDGLALNITVPDGTTPTSRYPVLAYLHGGGLNIGSSNWPIYDFTRLVRRSVSRGFPVICVGINYRLDIPGFLSSTALLAAGYKANRGFRDQQLALKWIAKHIAEFGGDPNHVTICGQSAGAVSIAYLFQSDEALFKRAIVMSGSDLLLKAEPPCDAGFDTACKALGLEDKSAEDKVKGMTSVPAEELLSKIGLSVRIGPVLDDDLFKLENSHESLIRGTPKLPATKWLDALLIGDCAFDVSPLDREILERS